MASLRPQCVKCLQRIKWHTEANRCNLFQIFNNSQRTDINSLWPSYAIWQHRSRSGSTLAQELACCLTPTKILHEPMLTSHQWDLVAFTWGQFHRKCARYFSLIIVWKVTNLRLQLHLQGPMGLSVQSQYIYKRLPSLIIFSFTYKINISISSGGLTWKLDNLLPAIQYLHTSNTEATIQLVMFTATVDDL